MRGLFIIDANSEEVIYSRRFITVESTLKTFFSSNEETVSPMIFAPLKTYFDFAPMPDNHIFKLAFSRQVISRDKLETEKIMLPHIQDYSVDQEEWKTLQKSMEGELKESVRQIIMQD